MVVTAAFLHDFWIIIATFGMFLVQVEMITAAALRCGFGGGLVVAAQLPSGFGVSRG